MTCIEYVLLKTRALLRTELRRPFIFVDYRVIGEKFISAISTCISCEICNDIIFVTISLSFNLLQFLVNCNDTFTRKINENCSIAVFATPMDFYLSSSDEPEPSWLEPGLEVNNFQLGSARGLFHSARKFPY